MSDKGFRSLRVWQASKDLAVQIYSITSDGKFARDFGLRDQIRRSAVSIPSNIAEGDERDTDRESVRFFFIAKGSAAELLTQLIIAHEIGYIDEQGFKEVELKCSDIAAMLSRLISARTKSLSLKP